MIQYEQKFKERQMRLFVKKEVIKTEMTVKDTIVSVMRVGNTDYISLTDLAKFKNDKNPANVIIHWLSNKDTALYVGLWEELNNENFNFTEYREIKIRLLTKSRFISGLFTFSKSFNNIFEFCLYFLFFIFFEGEYVDYATTFVNFLAIFFIFWAAQISHV